MVGIIKLEFMQNKINKLYTLIPENGRVWIVKCNTPTQHG